VVGIRVHTQLAPVSDKKLILKYLLGSHLTEIVEFKFLTPYRRVTLFDGVFFTQPTESSRFGAETLLKGAVH